MKFELNYLMQIDLKKPIAIAGLPGIAYIGKSSVEFLIKELKAERFAELYSEHFPGWVVREGGFAESLRVSFCEASLDEIDRDVILVTADAQAESSVGQYKLSERILDVIADEAADAFITMAAYLTPPDSSNPPVVAAASDLKTAQMISEHGISLIQGGRIVGMNGLLPGLARERGMWGFCLLGTTSGGDMDPDASKEVLSVLSDIIGLDLDLSNFKDRIPDFTKFRPSKVGITSGRTGKEDTGYIR